MALIGTIGSFMIQSSYEYESHIPTLLHIPVGILMFSGIVGSMVVVVTIIFAFTFIINVVSGSILAGFIFGIVNFFRGKRSTQTSN
jgi:uncharacterized membrane protein